MSNNSSSAIIGLILNEICYKFKIANVISLLLVVLDLFKKVFSKLRLAKRKKTNNVIVFINIFIKARYDARYRSLNLRVDNKIFLKLHYEYLISNLENRKLTQ